ncbi:DUF4377 domain-containing protein [Membranicola marinus]|uniref:DUF4377 domain-containing protein n=1 Tax=Membranihabitans marinus TaxID=1227546 RepID=A0A953HLS0_9BACT|nr:DUF4377 domain-containing protein [Membranihabitans marinus]MBY5957424.1 DUF4377 domain-containing protein [Membranihabitans marinus]
MTINNLLFLTLILLTLACNQTTEEKDATAENEFIYWVNSYKVVCTGVGEQMCLQIQRGEKVIPGAWENFHNEIQGFDWQPGYTYKLKVRENEIPPSQVPADASSIKHTLVEEIQKKLDPVVRLHDIWALEAIDGKAWESTTLERPTLEIKLTTGQVMGIDGCNRYHGSIENITPKKLVLGPLAATKKACPGMAQSDLFHKQMAKVQGYRLDELQLTLLDGDSQPLMQFKKVD